LALDLDRQIDQAFQELIQKPWGSAPGPAVWQPAIDIHETETEYLVEVDLPGVAPHEIELRIEGSLLTICGTRQTTTWVQTGRSLRVERAHGQFCRTVELPRPIDPGRIETVCEQGIFRARLPKKPSTRSPT